MRYAVIVEFKATRRVEVEAESEDEATKMGEELELDPLRSLITAEVHVVPADEYEEGVKYV